jgi:CxxC-x17-CxxC domain-containing protein
MQFADRVLKCEECKTEFVFTAGEQLFFSDKQFTNDPKRCKQCKAKRSAVGRAAIKVGAVPYARTETRTSCSACGIETTVPFKPTQGRPVLCRSCFQMKAVPSGVAAVANMDSPSAQVAAAEAALEAEFGGKAVEMSMSDTTMEMIAEAPAESLGEAEPSVSQAMIAAAEEAPQA